MSYRARVRVLSAGLVLAMLGAVSCAALADGPLQVSGVIQADEVRLGSEFQGSVSLVNVQAGAAITQGQVLVVLDSASVQSNAEQAQKTVEAAQADLDVVRASASAQAVAARRAALAVARAGQEGAQAALQVATEALREPQDLQEQIIAAQGQLALAAQGVQLAEAEATRAREVASQAEWNTPQRRILELEADSAAANVEAARADEHTAQVALWALQGMLARPIAYQAQAHAAEGNWRVAVAAERVRQAELDDLLAGTTQQEGAVAEARLRLAQAQLKLAQTQLERLTLRAPATGTVVERMVNPGEMAMPGMTLLTVADLSQVYVLVYVPEPRVGEVALGQAVMVSVDSFPGRSFDGRVVHIADQAQYTPRNVATKDERMNTVYAVKIRLPNAEGMLKPGMAADATFR
jgi:multidrug resistance efflux pump